jgi:hypothetical protein
MAAKKKSKKKTRAKKVQTRKASRKKSAKKKLTRQKTVAKRVAAHVTKARKSSAGPGRSRKRTRVASSPESRLLPALSGDADSQGLSDIEEADSESVSELLDEGNTFEAGIVGGVERADNAEGKEVRTREFPEDDVPEEYLDEQ